MAADLSWGARSEGTKWLSRRSLKYRRCVVKAVPMAMAAGAANLLAGVWAATGRGVSRALRSRK